MGLNIDNLDNIVCDPATFAREDELHDYFKWLREKDPVRYLTPDNYDPFWCVTRYEDIREVEGNRKVFINFPRTTLVPRGRDDAIRKLTGREKIIMSLVNMDDPDHHKYRVLTQGWFMGANLRKLAAEIERLADHYVNRLEILGGECDFVKDIAIWYPLRVIMSILGVPEEDETFMLKLTQELFGSSDPDVQRSFEMTDIISIVEDFEGYFTELSEARRKRPTDDVATLIANATIDGKPIQDSYANGYYIIVATAGHDTTSASTAGGLLELIKNPDQFEKLRSDPDQYLDGAVDEMIRWVSPVRHFMRTATEDYRLRGQTIKAGEATLLSYISANRDESVFEDPFNFDINRKTKHIAFGFGAHVCLGQHLARMEMSAFYRALLMRLDHIELAGEPRFTQSTFVGGLKSLPIRYRLK